jgi:putative transcriptional regulator
LPFSWLGSGGTLPRAFFDVIDPGVYGGLDVMLARRKMRSKELSERVGITVQNVSLLKSGKVKGVRFETLEAICEALDCQPGDILHYAADPP